MVRARTRIARSGVVRNACVICLAIGWMRKGVFWGLRVVINYQSRFFWQVDKPIKRRGEDEGKNDNRRLTAGITVKYYYACRIYILFHEIRVITNTLQESIKLIYLLFSSLFRQCF